ncbi:MAG: cell division protein FtsL [Burkholderiales bacterium]|nr:cell division protein FtsL [Burkholderiales bacterium]
MSARLAFILFVVLIACAFVLVTSQHKARKLYVELQKEQSAAKQIDDEWGQLQLEQGTWSTHGRIERIATRELGMRLPSSGRIEVVPAARPEMAQ